MTAPRSPALQVFHEEARELLAALEEGLLALEAGEDEAERINGIFRAVHTIKGSAGLFGLDPVVRFAHVAETLLDQVRARQVPLGGELVSLLLAAKDHLRVLLEAAEREVALTPDGALVARLQALTVGSAGAPPRPSAPAPAPERSRRFRVQARFGPDVLRDGMDPLAFLRFLERRGTLSAVRADLASLPAGAAFDPERCYLDLGFELETACEQRAVEEVFEFVRDSSEISVQELAAAAPDPAPAPEAAAAPAPLPSAPPPSAPAPSASAPPAPAPAAGAPGSAGERRTIKVQAEKLDLLVNLVGELVIASAASGVLAARSREAELVESLSALNLLVASIRDSALGLRMVQIGETFSRFRRVVRDVSVQLGKRIELELKGGDTELDKAMVERLADPLLHLVRNAIDHGIEPREARLAAGKPEVGRLTLEAFHQTGSVVIEVSDDGRGLPRARILQKAVALGLVAPDARLDDDEIAQLIFHPGLSSAEAVSDLSGRGVGMDVVKRSITDLRGTIEVLSTEGVGTTVRLRLPLTLAIIDGFQVGVGKASYVIPLDLVRECLGLGPVLESEANHRLDLRGEVVPFIRLRDLFRVPGERPARESVVVVEYGEARVGLVVDRLVGTSQTVIKPLGSLLQHVPGVEGSTILGSGEVALLLDIPRIIHLASARPRRLAPAA